MIVNKDNKNKNQAYQKGFELYNDVQGMKI